MTVWENRFSNAKTRQKFNNICLHVFHGLSSGACTHFFTKSTHPTEQKIYIMQHPFQPKAFTFVNLIN